MGVEPGPSGQKERHSFRMFEIRVLRTPFAPEGGEVSGGWREVRRRGVDKSLAL
jgi:hypothetical protein